MINVLKIILIALILLPLKSYSSQGTTLKKIDLRPDICTGQDRYRYLRTIEDNYPDVVERLMECQHTVKQVDINEPTFDPMTLFIGGIVIGILGGIYASK